MTNPFNVSAKTATAVIDLLARGADPTTFAFVFCCVFCVLGAAFTLKGN